MVKREEKQKKGNVTKVTITEPHRSSLLNTERVAQDHIAVANALIAVYQSTLVRRLVDAGYEEFNFGDNTRTFQMGLDGVVSLVPRIEVVKK